MRTIQWLRHVSTVTTAVASLASLTVAIMQGIWPLYGLAVVCLGLSVACWMDLE